MSNKDKKIISLVLVAIILLMPITTLAASSDNITFKDSKIFEAVKNYDTNKDGKISIEEMEKVTYLTVSETVTDMSDLQYAKNLSSLTLYYSNSLKGTDVLEKLPNLKSLMIYIKNDNLNINIIKNLKSLEYLSINDNLYGSSGKKTIDVSFIDNMPNLTSVGFYNVKISDMSKIANKTNLTSLSLSSCDLTDISSLKDLKELKYLAIGGNKDLKDISVIKNFTKLESISIWSTGLTIKELNQYIKFNDQVVYAGEHVTGKLTLPGIVSLTDFNITSSDESVLKKVESTYSSYFVASKAGTATITLTYKNDSSYKYSYKVTVKGIDPNQSLDSTKVDAKFIYDKVLTASGDLYDIYSETSTIGKVDTNVKNYVAEFVYPKGDYSLVIPYKFTLKNDGKMIYQFDTKKTEISNVKEVNNAGYLDNNGTYWAIKTDGTFAQVKTNVERIFDKYIVCSDGKTYLSNGTKLADFKATATVSRYIADDKNNVYYYDDSTVSKKASDFKEFTLTYGNYISTSGKIKTVFGQEEINYKVTYSEFKITKDNTLTYSDVKILTNVKDIKYAGDSKYVILRTDGSVWILTTSGANSGLVKVGKVDSYVTTKLNTTQKDDVTVLSGFVTGNNSDGLKISAVLSGGNFGNGYTIEAYKNDTKISGNTKLGTGMTIKVYANGKVVQEYKALIYGDVNGDGNMNSADALAIVKNKLNKEKITNELNLEAGRITDSVRTKKTEPTAADALAIVKAKLGRGTITQ